MHFRLKSSHTIMVQLRFLFRFFGAVVFLIGALSTFMALKSQHFVYECHGGEQTGSEDKQPCSTDHLRSLSENIRKSTEDTAKPSSNRGTTQATPPVLQTTKKPEKRRSLLIFGCDRSGTTFLTHLFSEDPNIFAVYEPLWITRDWSEKDVRDVISALMSCHFIDKPTALKFLASTSKKWAPGLFKNPFQSPPICNKTNDERTFCPNPATIPNVIEDVCTRHFKHSVTKVATVRLPERKLSNIFPQIIYDNPDTEIKLLHVVRDPRGSINSRINLGWIKDFQWSRFFSQPRATCQAITQNVKYGASLEGSLKQHYKMVRYKDIASSPVKTAQEIYKFAGFEMQRA